MKQSDPIIDAPTIGIIATAIAMVAAFLRAWMLRRRGTGASGQTESGITNGRALSIRQSLALLLSNDAITAERLTEMEVRLGELERRAGLPPWSSRRSTAQPDPGSSPGV